MGAISVMNTKLDFWVKNEQNVLFIGKHGVGKTAMVKETFDRHKLNWLYFSASTMDPWVDFIGVPREKIENKTPEEFKIIKELIAIDWVLAVEWVQNNWKMSENSAKKIVKYAHERKEGISHLELVRPMSFATGEVQALFFDEYNRSPKKVRNAVMELIQFKSINGMQFPKLKIIWAAINPDDDETQSYDVEKLDPAQADRYHVTVEVPYRPNVEWFRNKYRPRIADAALQWWDALDEDNKNLVSPRRLQYALDVYEKRGDMRDVLPQSSGIGKLATALNTGPMTEKLEHLMQSKDVAEAREFLKNENNYAAAMKFIPKSDTLLEYFMPVLPKEKISAVISEDDKMCNYIINNSDKIPVFREVCKQIIEANQNPRLVRKIKRSLTENTDLAKAFANDNNATPIAATYNKNPAKKWSVALSELKNYPLDTQQQRISLFDDILANIPSKMTADEALFCIEILGNTDFNNAVISEQIIGVTNHCIGEFTRNTGDNWETILKKFGSRFEPLLGKIKAANLMNRVLTPA